MVKKDKKGEDLCQVWAALLVGNKWTAKFFREVFKNPSNGNFPLRGYPPPL